MTTSYEVSGACRGQADVRAALHLELDEPKQVLSRQADRRRRRTFWFMQAE